MLLKSRCWQVLRQQICYHLVGSALHQLDNAIFDELVDEMLARIYVSRSLSFGFSAIAITARESSPSTDA
jgi:hypothetical protein